LDNTENEATNQLYYVGNSSAVVFHIKGMIKSVHFWGIWSVVVFYL